MIFLITTALVVNDVVTIKFVSNTKALNSFYEVPDNLERNAGNATFATLTLGQMRNHTVEISQQIKTFAGVTLVSLMPGLFLFTSILSSSTPATLMRLR